MTVPACETLDWPGCFRDSWKGVITPESFAHPAKFARGLIRKIIAFGLERGFWRPGDLIGDPFGGVALGGIEAAYSGLRWVGVELEEKFVALGRANIDKHRRALETLGEPLPVLLQGDSRGFTALVAGCEAVVTSPPFGEYKQGELQNDTRTNGQGVQYAGPMPARDMGSSPGQIGALPAGDLDGAITSPPYNLPMSQDHPGRSGGRRGEQPSEPGAFVKYGGTTGQIEGLPQGDLDGAITSPPFLGARSYTTPPHPTKHGGPCAERHHTIQAGDGYGDTPGQIGRLAAGELDGCVTSPPYEQGLSHVKAHHVSNDAGRKGKVKSAAKFSKADLAGRDYGSTPGQIGEDNGETYWMACKAVYEQMRFALKPGGVAAIVVKDYVRDKQRVPLADQTARLLEHVGFTVFLRCRALLVETRTHAHLFDGEVTKTKEKKSFFRRLAEKKGSPRIDHEEVLWCRKPGVR